MNILPKNEIELEAYFLLKSVEEAKIQNDRPFNVKYPHGETYENIYLERKKHYLDFMKINNLDK